jgi:hypothetical protein
MNSLRIYLDGMRKTVTQPRVPLILVLTVSSGRAVAQAVSRWLPTMMTRVRIRAPCEVCDGQSGTGAGFLRVLWFPLPIIIPPISPSS